MEPKEQNPLYNPVDRRARLRETWRLEEAIASRAVTQAAASEADALARARMHREGADSGGSDDNIPPAIEAYEPDENLGGNDA